MHNLFHRLAPCVALCLPLLSLAQTGRSDPAGPKSPAPLLRYFSAFADYKPWQDLKPADWRSVNDNVRDAGGKAGAHAGHAMPASAPTAAFAQVPKATAPAMPGHGGDQMPRSKP